MTESVNVAAAMMGAVEAAPAEIRPIEVITAEIQVLKAQVGVGLVEIGNRLLEAKAQLGHGEWLPWLEEKAQFSVAQAQRFMRLAKEYSNTSPVTNLGMRKALALLAFEPEEREAFAAEPHVVDGEEKTVEEMTSRELERAIRERKEALEAKETAEAERKAAEQARDAISRQMEIADHRVEELDETIGDLQRELEELRKQPIEVSGAAVPDEAALEAARKEGAGEAAQTARREAEERLRGKIEKAEKAKADAEARVQTIKAEQEADRARAAELEKRLKLVGNPAATEYKVHFDAAQRNVLSLCDCLDRLKASDPELCDRLTAAYMALGKKMYEDAGARMNGGDRA